MNPLVSKYSLEFRDLVVKVIQDDLSVKNKPLEIDPIIQSEKYKSIIDNINGFIIISNYALGLYEYISNGVFSNLGYDFTNFSKEEMTEFMISTVKDDHREFMFNKLFPTVLEYLKTNATYSTGNDYRYTCCLKLRNVYGNYVWFLVDTIIVEIDDQGFPIRTLITCTNIEGIKRDDCVYYNITKKNDDGIYQVVLEGTADNRINELNLTSREVEIINLIGHGHTNKEIAEKLFISLNTVQTHRKNIMRKTNCSGTAELTNFAFARGLL